MIKAVVHSKENYRSLVFDVTLYFIDSDENSIIELAKSKWRSPVLAQKLYGRYSYNQLTSFMNEIQTTEDDWWDIDFYVDRASAMNWLGLHRPDLAEKVLASERAL